MIHEFEGRNLLEEISADRLLALLPKDLQPAWEPYLKQEKGYDRDVVKAADKISAYIKCMEEKRAGNREFDYAAENIRASLFSVDLPAYAPDTVPKTRLIRRKRTVKVFTV